jgi:hypothetical protein
MTIGTSVGSGTKLACSCIPIESRKKKQKKARSQLAIQSDKRKELNEVDVIGGGKEVWFRKKWSQKPKAVEKRSKIKDIGKREWCKRRY